MQEETTLYGAGGHGKVVLDLLKKNGIKVDRIVDDNPGEKTLLGLKVRKPSKEFDNVVITVGNCVVRKDISLRITAKKYITAIHPDAYVSSYSEVGEGCVIMAGAVIQPGCKIGKHCIINTNASVDHDCMLEDFVHVASGATVCGETKIGECTWIGAGATVIQGVSIGHHCLIGAGAVIIRDVPDRAVVVGNPGRIIRILE